MTRMKSSRPPFAFLHRSPLPNPRPLRRPNTLRIVAGQWRGRLIRFADGDDLRPTPDRVRETLFNWLGQDLTGRTCLDLFAGSGALGIEALSRNAARVTFVERSRTAARAIRDALTVLDGAHGEVLCCDALEFLRSSIADERRQGRYDVVFLDPPFATDLLAKSLPRLGPLLAPDAVVYVEAAALEPLGEQWTIRKEGRAGAVRFALLARRPNRGEEEQP